MSPFVARLAVALAAAALTVGCTFLITFDDQPSCDGGLCADAAAPFDAAPFDAPARDAGVDARPHDAGPDTYAPCNGLASGLYCATDQIKAWAGSPDDLVQCESNQVAKITLCDGGCLSMPNPFPDTCSGCPDKPNGTYCGRDIPVFPHGDGGDDDFLIGCQAGNVSTSYPCPHGCKSNGNAASCYP